MNRRYKFIFLLLLVLQGFQLLAQVDNEFWFVVPEITRRHARDLGEPTYFRIASVGDSVYVTIEMPARGIVLDEILVPAGEYRHYDITPLIRTTGYNPADPTSGTYDDNNTIESGLPGTEGIVSDRGIRIWSRGTNTINRNRSITVYCDRFNNNNKDIWSLKGRNGMGVDFTIPSQNYAPNVSYSNDPMALNAFDIVATEDATTVTIIPTADIRNQIGPDFHYNAGSPIVVNLNKGETFSCVARTRAIGAHLGGSVVTSNNPIAITVKDDSLRPNDDGGYDTAGDQIIPDTLGGLEFVVMRGELTEEEYAFVMATKSGDTDVTYNLNGGGTNTITLTGRGDIQAIPMNAAAGNLVDALYLEADQKVLVWHITGFSDEIGGGLIPSIDLCTGSKDVTVVRSSNSERFFLSLMTKDANRDDFTIYIDRNADGDYNDANEVHTLDPSWFQQAGTTGWWYLDKAHNEFTDDAGGQGSPFGTRIEANTPCRITNPGRFHLGTIEGGGSGCKYGYFSSFSADTGSAVIGVDDKGIERYCYGDTIDLKASGAISYKWWYTGNLPDNEFVTSDTIEDPLTILRPSSSIWETYKVRIEKDCYDGASPFDTLDVEVQVYEEVNADFDTVPISPTCCSPTDYNIMHSNRTYTNHMWNIYRETDTLERDYSVTSGASIYSEDFLFSNSSYADRYFDVEHIVHKNYICYDTVIKPIRVSPQLVAKISKGSKSGCQQDIVQAFAVDTVAAGPFDVAIWTWGDGTGDTIVLHADAADSIYHTFTNLNDYDTTYYIDLDIIDSSGVCIASTLDSVFVPGIARARYAISNKKGCSPLDVTISNHSNGDVTYAWWINDDHNFSVAPTRTDNFTSITEAFRNDALTVPKEYYIYLEITKTNDDGSTCVDAYGPDTILVYPEFVTTIAPAGPIAGCNPVTVDFSQTTIPAVPNLQYAWDFGDGTSSGIADPLSKIYSHTQNTPVSYQANLTTTSEYNCTSVASPVDVEVYAFVDASFTVSPDTAGCSPLTLQVDNNSSSQSATNFVWTIADNIGDPADNASPFNVIYENTTGVTQTKTITLENSNANGCNVTFEKEINVFPEITANFSPNVSTICNGESITFTNSSIFSVINTPITGATANYLWSFGDGTTSSDENPSHNFTNTENNGTLTQDFTVSLTINVNGCESTYSEVISVYPLIVPQFNSTDYLICAPEAVLLTNESTGANSFLWRFSDGGANQSTTNVTYNFTNSSLNSIQSTSVTLIATNNICSDSITKNYTVYPELVPSVNADVIENCAPFDVIFTNSSTGGDLAANDFFVNWDFDDGDLQSDNSATVTHTFSNKGSTDLLHTVKMVLENAAGCKDSTTVDIDVWPELVADFTFVKGGSCAPSSNVVTIENTSLNGSVFAWDYGFDGQTASVTNRDPLVVNFYHTNTDLNAKDIYNIKLVASDVNHPQCIDSITRPITIYPPIVPDFNIPVNSSGCSPLVSTLSNTSTGYNLRYIWDFGDGNTSSATDETHEFRNLTNDSVDFNVTLIAIDSLNCSENFLATVRVYPEVVANFTFLKDSVCTPFPVEFSYPETAINGTRWEWNFGDGTTNMVDNIPRETFNHTFDNIGIAIENYQVELIAIDEATNCRDTIAKPIEVYPRLIPQFIVDVDEGCNPLTVQFTNQSTGIANYDWDFKDGQSSVENSPEHIFSHLSSNDEEYEVTLVAVQENTGCTKQISDLITVYSYVDANFSLAKVNAVKASKSDIVGGCHPFDVEIVDSSKTDGTWEWDFGDGTDGNMQQPGTLTYLNTDNTLPLDKEQYEVKLQVENQHGCFDRDSMKLEVYPRAVPGFNVENEGCHPHSVSFSDESIVDEGTRYYWRLGDGSTKVDSAFDYTYLNYSYTNIDTFYVNLRTTTSFGCADSITQAIIVRPSPSAELVAEIDRGCPPFTVSIENRSQGVNLTHFWKFDDRAPVVRRNELTTETFTYYNNSATDEIKSFLPYLTVENEFGCSDVDTTPVFVFPNVLVGFSADTTEGCSPLSVNYVNNSNASAKIFEWTFGDGQSSGSKNPIHIFYNETVQDVVYNVHLRGESEFGCWAEYSDTVSVYLTPVVDFDAKEPVQLYPETVISFKNLTQPGPWTHTWDLGNGDQYITQSLAEFNYDYETWGPKENDFIFPVTLNVNSGQCEDEKTHNVKILAPVPTVRVDTILPAHGCEPHTAEFEVYQENGRTWVWDFGDGNIDSTQSLIVNHTYEEAGVYNVKLTVYGDGGVWYDYEVVEVYPNPEASFVVNPEIVMLPDEKIHVFNTSVGGWKYFWDFDDGSPILETNNATGKNPSYLYDTEGEYDISLRVESNQFTLVGADTLYCWDTVTNEGAVRVDGTGQLQFPNVFTPVDGASDGRYILPELGSSDINFDMTKFYPWHSGVKEYEMWIFNRWGEQIFYTDDIMVGWNGRLNNNGRKLNQDVYFWKCKGRYNNGGAFKKSGDVTLIIQ